MYALIWDFLLNKFNNRDEKHDFYVTHNSYLICCNHVYGCNAYSGVKSTYLKEIFGFYALVRIISGYNKMKFAKMCILTPTIVIIFGSNEKFSSSIFG